MNHWPPHLRLQSELSMHAVVDADFSLTIGGPFHRLQCRMGLLGADQLPNARAALVAMAIAWLPLALLSFWTDRAWDPALGGRALFFDFGVYARFLIAVSVLVLMERVVERRLLSLLVQFQRAGLLGNEQLPAFRECVATAHRRSSSVLAEWLIFALALGASVRAGYASTDLMRDSWLGVAGAAGLVLTAAGWWAVLISYPLFWFLVLRWLWRFVIWARLLADLTRLDLQLVPTHPDRCGGLGFLAQFPATFVALIFALSCVAASAALQEIVFAGRSLSSLASVFAGWLAVVVLVFVGPLTTFAAPLARLKVSALLNYSAFVSHHNRAFQDKWTSPAPKGVDALGSPDVSSLADLGAGYMAVEGLLPIPADKATLLVVLVSASLPWLGVVLTQVPVLDVLKALAGALL
jgi:hypothetical protein